MHPMTDKNQCSRPHQYRLDDYH
uniref:Uncharacterized protein n=1 Tax=Arundo donax TaxID=35708 RepID=A0A0A9BXZ1_ARUDO